MKMDRNSGLPILEKSLDGSNERVLVITINRPVSLNSYDLETLTKLQQAIERGSQREETRVILLSGSSGSFSAGSDIDYLFRLKQRGDYRTVRKLLESTRNLILLLHRVPQFIISSIDGIAADGGLNIALACDWRLSSDRSLHSYPYLEIGLCPDVGSSWLLRTVVWLNRTQTMLTTGEQIGSDEAASFGLIHEIYNPYDQPERPFDLARRLANLPPLVLRNIKRSVISNVHPPDKLLSQDIENRLRCLTSDDFNEGIEAFLENRPPNFRNT